MSSVEVQVQLNQCKYKSIITMQGAQELQDQLKQNSQTERSSRTGSSHLQVCICNARAVIGAL